MELLAFLESVLGESEQKKHGNYRFKCPLPGCTSVRNRLEILLQTDENGHNKWKCWVCLRGGHSLRDLFIKANFDKDKIDKLENYIVSGEKTYTKNLAPVQLPKEFKFLDKLKPNDFVGRQCKVYLHKRGFSDDDIIKYNLGYCETGRYSNRIIFPSYDKNGNLNYFTGRTILEDEPMRYLYPETPRKDIVPFELYINWNVPIILCEGFFDAKTISRNVIPLLEKGITDGIMKKLLQSEVKKVYIVLDNDAMRESLDHAELLINNGKKVYLVELAGKDPNAMGFDSFTRLIQKTKAIDRNGIISRKLKFKLYE